jgi:tubulin monoglycylase TTLL3/8
LSPLKVWIYDEFYLRFCADDYNTDDLKNKYAHLTNNSIAKKSDNFGKDENT